MTVGLAVGSVALIALMLCSGVPAAESDAVDLELPESDAVNVPLY